MSAVGHFIPLPVSQFIRNDPDLLLQIRPEIDKEYLLMGVFSIAVGTESAVRFDAVSTSVWAARLQKPLNYWSQPSRANDGAPVAGRP